MQQILFIVITLAVALFARKLYGRIYKNIKLGQDSEITGDTSERWKNVLLIAFGQKKMFKRWIPAVLHLCVYVAFLFTQVELIEIIIDGVTGKHRIFAPYLGGFYTFLISTIEVLSLLALIATFAFLVRRNLLKIPRFVMDEMTGWPKIDANLILLAEFLLVVGIFTMNGADTVLQTLDPAHYPDTGNLLISSKLGPALFGGLEHGTLVVLERMGWWLHYLVVLGFILYLPISKHLHIFLAFPNTYFANLKPRGEMENMPAIMKEVKSMMGLIPESEVDMSAEIPTFGSKDVTDLPWKTLLDAYTCTECGRCSSVCPASQTGKKLSPRKVLMDIRDRATEIGMNIESGDEQFLSATAKEQGLPLSKDTYEDGKSLFDYITREEINACTTCNACVEACPVLISPLDPILKLRRYQILTESAGPADWTPMFTSLENTGSVWQMGTPRSQWTQEMESEVE